ncbi:MAG: homocysteine S-methyltransferase family protein [Bacillota bacterium]|nr:homocysteine S-methyltransferase family protein [Bacillota bacterium]
MKITDKIKNEIVYFDGGTGTLLQSRGLKPGELPEMWNISRPDEIIRLHREYLEAGCDIIKTNTFGANRLKFTGKDNIPSVYDVVSCAITNAKKATSGFSDKYIALDIGPCGKLLKPLGDLDFEDAVSLFAEIVKIGADMGVDLILIETMNDSYETKAAVIAAKENCLLPVFVTNVYDATQKLMTGACPEVMAAMLEGLHADAIGVNCSLGPKQLLPAVERLLKASSLPIIVNPNAGLPRSENGNTVYDIDADQFADEVAEMVNMGIRVAGGCCGTTPEHIRTLIEKTKSITPVPIAPKNFTVISSFSKYVEFGNDPLIIGERINPTGKKAFKEALRNHDIGYILNEGITQQDSGAHVLDVNVGLPEIDEPAMMKEAVCELQSITDLPLQIDTSDYFAMENALRIYNGKSMINSVSGKQESMDAVFPLAAKYGGVIVALTLDEKGIPENAAGRFEIAEKICREAARYGILKKDLVIDPLAMAVSSDPKSADVTLEALRMLTNAGYRTSLGVSNISFGLPVREYINSTFFTMALENGLSAAIMNPKSAAMLSVWHSFRALKGLDKACSDYIGFAAENTAPPVQTGCDITLKDAITRGLKEQAATAAKELILSRKPLDIIDNEIIPALDIVGKGFEQQKVFLPQLLMSAEASKCAFDVIKTVMGKSDAKKCTIILATVKGDIHDIGKNIVKVLLENYGFDVIDLGRDVPPEKIVEAAISHKAPLVGLSALMTTTVPSMEETIRLLRVAAAECKIVVGGAVLTQEYADMIGADKYAADAMESVRYAEIINKEYLKKIR